MTLMCLGLRKERLWTHVSAIAAGLALAGCDATIECPEVQGETRYVYLLDHGRHAGLGIWAGDNSVIRYGFGDWQYYAETRTGFRSGARALLWPTKAAQARRAYKVQSAEPEAVADAVLVPVKAVYRFEVPESAAYRLQRKLDRAFKDASQQEHLVNLRADFEFAPHPEAYWLGNSSNHKVASWFETLGCDVSGSVTFTVGFDVNTPS